MRRINGFARASGLRLLTVGGVTAVVAFAGGPLRAADSRDVSAVLDKAIQALGGEEKLSKIKAVSWSAKGTIAVNGSDSDVSTRTVLQGLDHARQEFEGEFGGNPVKGVEILSGDKGWRDIGENHSQLQKDDIAAARQRTYLTLVPITVLPLKCKEFKVEATDDVSVGGKSAAGVRATGPDGKEFLLYFDKESGLPVRLVAKVTGFMGEELTQESMFSDYQDAAGIKKAMKLQIKRDGQKFLDEQIADFKVLDQVDAKAFAESQ